MGKDDNVVFEPESRLLWEFAQISPQGKCPRAVFRAKSTLGGSYNHSYGQKLNSLTTRARNPPLRGSPDSNRPFLVIENNGKRR